MNKMKLRCTCYGRIAFVILLMLSVFGVNAQNRGVVLNDKSRAPLPGVNIASGDGKTIAITDDNGEFSLQNITRMGRHDTISVSHIGYISRKLTVSQLQKSDYIILLAEDVQYLSEITVISPKEQSLNTLIGYKELAPVPDGVYSFGASLVGDKIYVTGGDKSNIEDEALKTMQRLEAQSSASMTDFLNKLGASATWLHYNEHIYVYDIPNNKWETKKKKLKKRAYHGAHHYNGKIYILGGKRLSRSQKLQYLDESIEVYNLSKDTTTSTNSNLHQASNFASFVVDDNIIVMGGSVKQREDETRVYTDKAYLLNLKTGYWYELDNMPQSKEAKGTVIQDKIYLIGGYRHKPLRDIDIYQLSTGKWNTSQKLLYEVERPAIACHRNTIYIFEKGRIQTFDTNTNEVNAYLIDLPLKYSEMFCIGDKLYIVGGATEEEAFRLPSAGLYSVDLNQFGKAKKYNNW